MSFNGPTPEFRDLVARLCDGDLSPPEAQRLEEIATADGESMQYYLQYLDLHGTMRRYATADSGGCTTPSPQHAGLENTSRVGADVFEPALQQMEKLPPIVFDEQTLPSRWPWFAGGIVFACTLVAVAFLAFRTLGEPQLAQVQPPHVPSSTAVAFLTVANGCNWGKSGLNTLSVGQSVQSGEELTLHEGIAEFNLSSGVTLSIEGPAALLLNSPNSLVVHFGKVTVYVPWTVNDFKMLASSCPISACDAGFGVNVLGSTVDLHVFSGEVIVGSSPFESLAADEWEYGIENVPVQREEDLPSGSEFIKALVAKGRAVQVSDRDGTMKVSRWHAAKTSEFAAKLSMAGSLPVTASYVQAIIKSKPVGYWRFESQEESRVVNQVSPSNDLLIVGNVKLIGDEENRVAEFGRSRSEGHMVSSKPLDALAGHDYSAEFWLKPSHSHRGGLMGLAVNQHRDSDQVGPTNLHGFFLEIVGTLKPAALVELGLKEPNAIRFLHRDPPGSEYRMGTSCFSNTPYVVRRWQHVVAVKAGPEMRLYLNGKLTAKGNDSSSLAKGLYLEVGQLIGTHEIVPFVGQLDELSVYSRALTTAEIKRHYKAIDWTTKRGAANSDAKAKSGKDEV